MQHYGAAGFSALMIADVPLENLTNYAFGIYCVMTIVTMFCGRTDFINLTLSAVGFMLTYDNSNHFKIKKDQGFYLKLFVVALASLLYDAVYLSIVFKQWNPLPGETSLEVIIRHISTILSIVSLAFRFLILNLF